MSRPRRTTTRGELIHGAVCSMQNTDRERSVFAAVEALFAKSAWGDWGLPHWMIVSEASRGHGYVHPLLTEAVEAHGWYMTSSPRTDVAILVNPILTVTSASYRKVLAGRGGMPEGNYPERGIVTVRTKTRRGNKMKVLGAHWNTAYRLDNTPGPEDRREAGNISITKAMIEETADEAAGSSIAFAGGDLNVDAFRDRTGFDTSGPTHLFEQAGMVPIFTDARRWPDTLNRSTYDWLLRCKQDRRVSYRNLRVWPKSTSDHSRVSGLWWVRDPLLGFR